ncbi:hypothetical protein WICMUC_005699 [Wickerhamomyces mucosus]|uniref:Uncharacterized protein n=1 Tax=Wickerhamomyces mucosus TaxID=1378264 RepID=A0A9P8P7E4_9ASCO|nr:hypothetical protein WICMUC_005699 [Wickerhamomyces mucosus]
MSSEFFNGKENLKDPESKLPQLLSPSASGSKGPASVLWDSNDPMRNPPPLPLSPQMLRINNSNSKSGSPTPIGKLQFANSDSSDVEAQLKKILDTQMSLKSFYSSINSSVKQTQLDLENLVDRSSNNNSHLKDLLQSVSTATTTRVTTIKDHTAVTKEEISEIISSGLVPILKKYEELDRIQEFQQKLENFEASLVSKEASLKEGIEDLLSKVSKMPSGKELREIFSEQNKTHSQVTAAFADLKLLSEISTKDWGSKIEASIIKQINVIQEDIQKNNSRLESNTKSNFLSLKVQMEQLVKVHDSLNASQAPSLNLPNIVEDIKEQEKVLVEGIRRLEQIILESRKSYDASINNFQSVSKKISQIQEKISSTNDETKIEGLVKSLHSAVENNYLQIQESIETKFISDELEKRDLLLQLKDNEIEGLKEKLRLRSEQEELSKDIIDLNKQKYKLELQLESLNEAYFKRLSEFKGLAEEHQNLNKQILESSTEKLKAIYGSTLVLNNPTTSLDPKKSSSSNRVFSTNSYLGNPKGNSSNKVRKKYQFSEDISEDNSDKENILI